jgi:hypothetical protein
MGFWKDEPLGGGQFCVFEAVKHVLQWTATFEFEVEFPEYEDHGVEIKQAANVGDSEIAGFNSGQGYENRIYSFSRSARSFTL